MEAQLGKALKSRLQHFQDNADSLTLEGVRRLLEKDLGLELHALDVHKRLIKQLMEKLMEGQDDNDTSENPLMHEEGNVSSTKAEAAGTPEKNEIKKDHEEPASENGTKTDDSPIMGIMTTKVDSVVAQSTKITESKIKKAVWKRASHLEDNSETITPAGVRRLLEEDLGLPTNTLDPFKKFISTQIDEVFASSKVDKSPTGLKEKKNSRNNKIEVPEKSISERSSGSLDSENEEVDEKPKSRKKAAAPRENINKSLGLKKRKGPQKEVTVSSKKQKTLAKKPSGVDEGDEDSASDEIQSEISSEKPLKNKQLPTPGYGKRVENLRSIIKACGMSVAPSLYKKAKQVPDGKREIFLIKELEEILSREGLSTNPSEKDIKEVRKRKETAKELEGIDLSNIVSSSRRRASTTFMAPPKPKVRAKHPEHDIKSSKKNENDEEDDDDIDKEAPKEKEEKEEEGEEAKETEEKEDDEEEEEEDDDDDSESESESEGFNEDDDDDSD